ncbi:MAG: energy transducer TonB [Calditrichia bacterium]|nr:energy transducer TonB [Calditrichia bacterium]
MPNLTPDKRKQMDKIKLSYRRTIDIGFVLSLSMLILIFYSFQKSGEVEYIDIFIPDDTIVLDVPDNTDKPKLVEPDRPPIPIAGDDDDPELKNETIKERKFDYIPDIIEDHGFETINEPEIPYHKVEIKPKLIKTIPTVYPEIARRARLQGQVVLEVLIGTNGHVEKVRVLKSIKGLDKAAIEAAKQYVFSPAVQADRNVKVWMAIQIQFKLQ